MNKIYDRHSFDYLGLPLDFIRTGFFSQQTQRHEKQNLRLNTNTSHK